MLTKKMLGKAETCKPYLRQGGKRKAESKLT